MRRSRPYSKKCTEHCQTPIPTPISPYSSSSFLHKCVLFISVAGSIFTREGWVANAASPPAFVPLDDDVIKISAPIDTPANSHPSTNVPIVISEQNIKKKKNPPSSKIKKEDDSISHLPTSTSSQHTQAHSQTSSIIDEENENSSNISFINWCTKSLGINTLLVPKQFEYVDYLSESRRLTILDGGDEPLPTTASNQDIPTVQIRGLAASRDIEIGEIVISIPYHALLSVETTTDNDPVLSRVLGPTARKKYGWSLDDHSTQDNDNGSHDEVLFDSELPLLIITILYHKSLGPELSPIWRYIDSLLSAPVDSIPFLWDKRKLRRDDGISSGVKKIAKDIQKDIREMYDVVMQVLLTNHPEIFGPPTSTSSNISGTNGENDSDEQKRSNTENSTFNNMNEKQKADEKWMYSFEEFQWAFAIVNSRHWFLPLADTQDDHMKLHNTGINGTTESNTKNHHETDIGVNVEEIGESSAHADAPPATQPTDAWIHDQDQGNNDSENTQQSINKGKRANHHRQHQQKHSFMAPLADMLNFGPACTNAQYNPETESFEVIATCSFKQGEEVTYWYSDDCEDIIIANYGFTHPMVTRCLTLEDWKKYAEEWMAYAESLEDTIENRCGCEGNEDDGDDQMINTNTLPPTRTASADNTSTGGQRSNDSTMVYQSGEESKQNDNGRVRRTRQRYKEDLGL